MIVQVLGFDLGLAAQTGWALLTSDGDTVWVEGGVMPRFKLKPSERGREKEWMAVRRIRFLEDGITNLMLEHLFRPNTANGGMTVIVYESFDWLAAASRQGTSRKPVTRDSMYAMIAAQTCLRAAAGTWLKHCLDPSCITIRGVGTMEARRRIDVMSWAKVGVEEMTLADAAVHYGNVGKAEVVIGVTARLRADDIPVQLPATSHGADALLVAMFAWDILQQAVGLPGGLTPSAISDILVS